MHQALTLILGGVCVGSAYALVALGMVIVYRATEVINFAHPGLLVLGTFVAAATHTSWHWPFLLALLAGVAVAVGVAALVDRVLLRPFRRRDATLAAGIMTIGLSIILGSLTTTWIGADVLSPGLPFGSRTIDIAGVAVPTARVVALVVAIVLLLGFQWWLNRSSFGLELRAAAEDAETAELMGARLGKVSLIAWMVAALLAVVAGVFLVSYPSAGLDSSVTVVALQAIPAVVIGGIDSTTGAVVGGLAVGLTQSLALGYQDQLDFLGRSFFTAAPFLLMLLVLLIRPAGLFGRREVFRV